MLHWKATYIIMGIVFGVIGFTGIGDGGLQTVKYICVMFLILLGAFWTADLIGRK